MKLRNYLQLLPIKSILTLIKGRRHIKLHFTDTTTGEKYRLKTIWLNNLEAEESFAGAISTDFRKYQNMKNWPAYNVDIYDAVKLIFEYPWHE